MVDKKVLLLILVTSIVILGMIFEPSKGNVQSTTRYIIAGIGEFSIIAISVLIGIDGIKFFTSKSALGKSLLFISMGIFSWGIGALLWLYYNLFSKMEVPYPSWADVFFILTVPFASYGLLMMIKSTKLKVDAKTLLKVVLIPLLTLTITYVLFISGKLGEDVGLLEKLLNVAYPLGDTIFLSFTCVLLSLTFWSASLKPLLFKPLCLLSVGFALEGIADFSFSYTAAIGTYYTGNWVDIIFSLAFFTIGLGIYSIVSAHRKFISQKSEKNNKTSP